MEQSFIKYIYEFFKRLIEVYDFQKKRELSEGQSYMIEYGSNIFVIKIEKYFREFYISLYKVNRPDEEVNLFNLLEYLKQGDSDIPKSEYFPKEKDIQESYIQQLNHISSVIYENYDLINGFFIDNNYELRMAGFENYWKNKHPEFYK
ncbi:hypothetical protein [Parapedobacter sp. DT-150]|uniref:hypothetical protein n=1 Tax=Parapedobacter sp. DT-150 TaxID=3396162 RepID=UPI003F1A70CA